MHILIFEITGPSSEPHILPRIKTTWPEFGLPPNYSSPFTDASGVGSSTQHVVQLPIIPEMKPPLVIHTMALRPFNDPRYAYHDVGSHNDDSEERKEFIEVE